MALDDEVVALGVRQHGAVARAQLLRSGATSSQVQAWLDAGRLRSRFPGVYAFPGRPDTRFSAIWTAHLAVGPASLVSHECAARRVGFPSVSVGAPVLTVRHGMRLTLDGVTIHQSRDLPLDPRWVTSIEGLPVTTPARTALDLAAVYRPARLRLIIDEARASGVLTLAGVGECLSAFARRGKPGVRRLAKVLDELAGAPAPPASVLERRLLRVLADAGLPPPVQQLAHPGAEFMSGCVDVGYGDARLIVEADGRRWHTRIQDLKRDHDRDSSAAASGWLTLRVLHEQLVADPEGVARQVAQVRKVRLRQLGAVA